jgi:SAM-dependent methyltransferase
MRDTPREQRLVFGEVAETYDRARPGYPPALVDDVLSLTRLGAGDRALEVGCGTGKATVQFAERGVEMLCLEPSDHMAVVARRNCERFPGITIKTASFEECPVEQGGFRLLVSAQAWHWISPEVRLPKAHEVLAPDGLLAVFWNWVDWRDEQMRAAIDGLYERLAPNFIARRPGYPGTRPPLEEWPAVRELDESPLFEPVIEREYPWSETYTTAGYVELLSTHSDHRMLPADVFARLAEGVEKFIDERGGELRIDYVARLYVGHRSPESV